MPGENATPNTLGFRKFWMGLFDQKDVGGHKISLVDIMMQYWLRETWPHLFLYQPEIGGEQPLLNKIMYCWFTWLNALAYIAVKLAVILFNFYESSLLDDVNVGAMQKSAIISGKFWELLFAIWMIPGWDFFFMLLSNHLWVSIQLELQLNWMMIILFLLSIGYGNMNLILNSMNNYTVGSAPFLLCINGAIMCEILLNKKINKVMAYTTMFVELIMSLVIEGAVEIEWGSIFGCVSIGFLSILIYRIEPMKDKPESTYLPWKFFGRRIRSRIVQTISVSIITYMIVSEYMNLVDFIKHERQPSNKILKLRVLLGVEFKGT